MKFAPISIGAALCTLGFATAYWVDVVTFQDAIVGLGVGTVAAILGLKER